MGGPDVGFGDSDLDSTLAEFSERWWLGEAPAAEEYFQRLGPDRPAERVELIYREYCLAESAGLAPVSCEYLERFAQYRQPLSRLFAIHDALGSSRAGGSPRPVSMPEVGDEIGPYRLIHELGRGGFASVFLAEQTDLADRLVVLKVSSWDTQEPRLLARSSHPHIVELLWHGEVADGSLHVICMPFLGGTTLSGLLAARRRGGARPRAGRVLLNDLDRASAAGYPAPGSSRPARALIEASSYAGATAWLVARLAEALDFAYGRNVIHGDIKPSNILITADGVPMLLDFNLAVGWEPRAPDALVVDLPSDPGGTLDYMAPERLRMAAGPGHDRRPTPADRHRADVYSLGLVLLEVLTGPAPEVPDGPALSFPGLASACAASSRRQAEVLTRSGRPSLPVGLRSILARCLAPDPADRYTRASELAEDLDRWRDDRPWRSPANRREGSASSAGLVDVARS